MQVTEAPAAMAKRRTGKTAKKKAKPRQTLKQTYDTLRTDEARRRIPAHQRDAQLESLRRRRKSIRRIVPSSPWFDVLWGELDQQFPPGGDATGMIFCTSCHRWTPVGACGGKTRCYDCFLCDQPRHFIEALPSSPGIIDMGKVAKNARVGKSYAS